ncbi:acyltransferase [Nocardioides sp. YIM 152315]|nr:acyltransferase [Nocardioides sp. YIM 152315]
MQRTAATPESRHRLFDGIRGVAIVLVILSHGWALWPTDDLLSNEWLKPFFTSGNFAVSIFFIVGGFLATRSILRHQDSGAELHIGVIAVRRYVRLSGQLLVLLLVVLIVTATDDASSYPENETGTSALRIATYTWNWYLVSSPLSARPDLGHLWYLSVDFQIFLLVLVLAYLMARHRAWLAATLGALLLASIAWRVHVYDSEGAYQALLQTTTRMDAPLTGALAAVALTYVGGWRRFTRPLLVLSSVALVPVLILADDGDGFVGWPGALLDATLLVFVVTAVVATAPRLLDRILGNPALTVLGRRSLSLYLWHYPIFWFVSRHTVDWSWEMRTVVALMATFVIAELSERLVETRVQRLLQSPRWGELDGGIPRYVVGRARRWWHEPGGGTSAGTPADREDHQVRNQAERDLPA